MELNLQHFGHPFGFHKLLVCAHLLNCGKAHIDQGLALGAQRSSKHFNSSPSTLSDPRHSIDISQFQNIAFLWKCTGTYPPLSLAPLVDDVHLKPPLLMTPFSSCTHVLHQNSGLPPLSMTHFGDFWHPLDDDVLALSMTRRYHSISQIKIFYIGLALDFSERKKNN